MTGMPRSMNTREHSFVILCCLHSLETILGAVVVAIGPAFLNVCFQEAEVDQIIIDK
jgi:hypothetical protein